MPYEVIDGTGNMDPATNWDKIKRMLLELFTTKASNQSPSFTTKLQVGSATITPDDGGVTGKTSFTTTQTGGINRWFFYDPINDSRLIVAEKTLVKYFQLVPDTGQCNSVGVNWGVGAAAFTPGTSLLTLSGGAFNKASYTFATLPSTPLIGDEVRITDSNTTTFYANAAGGGANNVSVIWNGTNWKVN